METYMSIAGIAAYLGIAEKTVRKWVLNREIPFYKIKKVIRFRLSEIEQWVSNSGKYPVASEDEIQESDLFENDDTGLVGDEQLEVSDSNVSDGASHG